MDEKGTKVFENDLKGSHEKMKNYRKLEIISTIKMRKKTKRDALSAKILKSTVDKDRQK